MGPFRPESGAYAVTRFAAKTLAHQIKRGRNEPDRHDRCHMIMIKILPLPLAIALATPAFAASAPDERTPPRPGDLTTAERETLIAQIARCVPPINISVRSITTIDLRLNRDGSVSEESKVVASPTQAVGRAMLKAAHQCQPYRLPSQKYENWKDIRVDFDTGPPKRD